MYALRISGEMMTMSPFKGQRQWWVRAGQLMVNGASAVIVGRDGRTVSCVGDWD